MSFDGDEIAQSGIIAVAVTQIVKDTIFAKYPKIPREILPYLPTVFAVLFLITKYLGDGRTYKDALFNGISGGIAATLAYRAIVGPEKEKAHEEGYEEALEEKKR